jgi:thiamine transport system permease protein
MVEGRFGVRSAARFLAPLALLALSLYWLTLVGIPLLAVISRAGPGTAESTLLDSGVLSIMRATIWQAAWSTVLSGAIGLPLGLWMGCQNFQRWSRTLLAIPYGIPTVVVATAWVLWLGRTGLFSFFGFHPDWIYSLKAVIFAHVFLNVPWVALLVSQAFQEVPTELWESALSLSASLPRLFLDIFWPEVKWAFAAAVAQVFTLCTLSFTLVLLLGGGPPVQSLETAVYSRIRFGSLDISGAAACAFWEILVSLTPWLIVLLLQARRGSVAPKRSVVQKSLLAALVRNQKAVRVLGILSLIGLSVFVVPYFVVVGPVAWHFLLDAELLREMAHPFEISLLLASFSAAGALLVAAAGILVCTRFKKLSFFISFLIAVPSGVSLLVLGLGIWLAYGKFFDPFSGSLGAMVAIQVTAFSPVAYRLLWPVAQSIPWSMIESAHSLGAGPVEVFRSIEWPRWRAPVLSAVSLVLGASLGEVAAVSLFYSENLIPLPLLISRMMSQYRFGEAEAVSAGLLILAFMSMSMVILLGSPEESS